MPVRTSPSRGESTIQAGLGRHVEGGEGDWPSGSRLLFGSRIRIDSCCLNSSACFGPTPQRAVPVSASVRCLGGGFGEKECDEVLIG